LNDNCSKHIKAWSGRTAQSIIRGGLLAAFAVAVSGIASAQYADEDKQDKKDEITFSLLPSPVTSNTIKVPEGNSAFLAGHGVVRKAMFAYPPAQAPPGP
jgi:hypothetical protein